MKTLTASLLLMSAAAAFANEAGDERMNHAAPFESQLTRDQVVGEYLSARADRTLPDTSEGGSAFVQGSDATRSAGRTLTRAEVVAEFIRARADGTLPDTSEAGSMHAPIFIQNQGPRPDVYAEAVANADDQASE